MIAVLGLVLAVVAVLALRARKRARAVGASVARPMVVSVREVEHGPRHRFKGSAGNL